MDVIFIADDNIAFEVFEREPYYLREVKEGARWTLDVLVFFSLTADKANVSPEIFRSIY